MSIPQGTRDAKTAANLGVPEVTAGRAKWRQQKRAGARMRDEASGEGHQCGWCVVAWPRSARASQMLVSITGTSVCRAGPQHQPRRECLGGRVSLSLWSGDGDTFLSYKYPVSSLTCWQQRAALLTPRLPDQAGTAVPSPFPHFSKDACTSETRQGLNMDFRRLLNTAVCLQWRWRVVSGTVSSPSCAGGKRDGFPTRQVLREQRYGGSGGGGGIRVDVEEQMGPAKLPNLFSRLFLSTILYLTPKVSFPKVS